MLGHGFGNTSVEYRNPISDLNPAIWLVFNKNNVANGAAPERVINGGIGGNDFDALVGSGNPTFLHGAINLGAIDFDGTDDTMRLGQPFQSSNKSFTFAMVFQKDDTGNDVAVCETEDLSSGFWMRIAGSNGRVDMRMGASFDQDRAFALTQAFVADKPQLLIVSRRTGGEVFIYNHEGQIATNSANEHVLAMPHIKWQNVSGTANDLNGKVGEIIQFDGDLSAAGIATIQNEMALKWSIPAY